MGADLPSWHLALGRNECLERSDPVIKLIQERVVHCPVIRRNHRLKALQTALLDRENGAPHPTFDVARPGDLFCHTGTEGNHPPVNPALPSPLPMYGHFFIKFQRNSVRWFSIIITIGP